MGIKGIVIRKFHDSNLLKISLKNFVFWNRISMSIGRLILLRGRFFKSAKLTFYL